MNHHGLIFSLIELSYPEDHHWVAQPVRSYGSHKIASHMRDEGWDVEVVDFFAFWTLDELKSLVDSRITKDTKFIGFSVLFFTMWHTMHKQHELCKYVRKYYPWVTFISGGNKFASITNMVSDYYVAGFGEYAMQHLCNYLAGYGPKPIIRTTTPTLAQVESGVFLNKTYSVILATDDYPAYPKVHVKTSFENRDFLEPEETVTTELSRGCRFACPFCNYAPLGVKGDHSRSADDFESEMRENYDKWGITNYLLSDETINDYTEKLEKYGKVVQSLPFSPKFHGFLRADLLISRGEREWDACINMNLVGHHYGIETFNHDSGKIIGKGMHPDRMKAGLLYMDDYMTRNTPHYHAVSQTLIVGLPNETMNSLKQTAKWYCEEYPNRFVEFNEYVIQNDEENELDHRADFEKQENLYKWIPSPESMTKLVDNRWRGGHWLDNRTKDWKFSRQKIWEHPSGEYNEEDARLFCIDFRKKLAAARGLKRQYAAASIWQLPYVTVLKRDPRNIWNPKRLGSFPPNSRHLWGKLMSRYKRAKLSL